MDHRRRGLLLAAGATAMLSTDGVLVRAAHADAFDVMFWTGLLSSASAFGFAALGDRTPPLARVRRSGRAGVVAGLLQGATVVGFVLGVSHTSVANTMVIIAASPAVTGLVGWLVLRERTTARVWAAIGISLAAVAVIVSGSVGGGTVGGDLAAVGAATAYSLLTVVLRRHPGVDRAAVVGIGGVVMATVAAGPADVLGHPARTWVVLVTMGVVVGPLSRVMITSAPRYLPATEVALFAPVETVLAIVWAYVFYDEAPPTRTWLGGAAIVAAVVWATLPARPRHVTLAG